jgi:hypothetical protein
MASCLEPMPMQFKTTPDDLLLILDLINKVQNQRSYQNALL